MRASADVHRVGSEQMELARWLTLANQSLIAALLGFPAASGKLVDWFLAPAQLLLVLSPHSTMAVEEAQNDLVAQFDSVV